MCMCVHAYVHACVCVNACVRVLYLWSSMPVILSNYQFDWSGVVLQRDQRASVSMYAYSTCIAACTPASTKLLCERYGIYMYMYTYTYTVCTCTCIGWPLPQHTLCMYEHVISQIRLANTTIRLC